MNPILQKNLSYLKPDLAEKILHSPDVGNLEISKTGNQILKIDSIYFHSKQDPILEAQRFMDSIKQDSEKRLFLFFGAGLGYSVHLTLNNSEVKIIWLEVEASILRYALEIFDYSKFLENEKLKIILAPFTEENLYDTFRGLASYLVSFIPHKPSFNWKELEYSEMKFLSEKFFKKKDANIATLSRFEKLWTRNILQNFPDLLRFSPISRLFGILKDTPVVVCGAGPSLYSSLKDIARYRDKFILITVDTSLKILTSHGIEPDLIYSVDPQALNTNYLEGNISNAKIVFDPTSSYHTLRLENQFQNGFITDSPFPIFSIFSNQCKESIGEIPYGGSVSTNAVSLADLMGASEIYLVGQDLAFTDNFAHCKGAILEERLNFKESRFFRREKHNFLQLFALPKLINISYTEKELHTNEKMQIFLRWFEENSRDKKIFNLSNKGSKINNIPYKDFLEAFKNISDEKVSLAKKIIRQISEDSIGQIELSKSIESTIYDIEKFTSLLKKGLELSEKIYSHIKNKNRSSIQNYLDAIDKIDEEVSTKKGLNEIIGMSVQRTILRITEGYEMNLSLEEKKSSDLSIAKKSVLLYSGLYDGTKLILILLKKILWRLGNDKAKSKEIFN
jgi:hypothetical protein